MSAPDATLLLRAIAGETVFGLDVDSRIRQAANGMSARLMIELFHRLDTSSADWEREFISALNAIEEDCGTGDPSFLIGFDDGRWQGLEAGEDFEEEEEEEEPDTSSEHYLQLRFTSEDAAYFQFHLFPTFDEPFIQGAARKREGDSQFLMIEVARKEDLQIFIQNLRRNPHLVAVEEITAEAFENAASQAI